MNKNFKINGAITAKTLMTQDNLIVQGNLEVKGSTHTVNQETLTIKDNLIAVNGNGTTLDTAGMAGIVAITGAEQYKLNDGNYKINFTPLYESLAIEYSNEVDPYAEHYIISSLNVEQVNKFNSLGLCVQDFSP
jgi:hypothetical protein